MTPDRIDSVGAQLSTLKQRYDEGENDLDGLGGLGRLCLETLDDVAELAHQGCVRLLTGGEKRYHVFERRGRPSRPVREALMVFSADHFGREWETFTGVVEDSAGAKRLECERVNELLYTCVSAFACLYDLLKSASRKTPGTFFEILVGSLLGKVTGVPRRKMVSVPNRSYKVTTDLVLDASPERSLVVASKITTRERVVQPFVHQRILDSVFGESRYRTIFACVSETQRDRRRGVNEICLPHQVGLYQEFIGHAEGMYYLDPPAAYLALSPDTIRVATFSDLLRDDLTRLV